MPFDWNIPLIILALTSILAIVFSHRTYPTASLPLIFPVFVFLMVTGLSILVSEDISRSLRLSAPLLPAVLLFFLIAGYFHSLRHTRLLYITFSIVGLALGSVLLWTAWRNGWVPPSTCILIAGSPILIVPNDVTFLAVIAPFSLVLLYREPRSTAGLLAALSILVSVSIMCILMSRVAILTMIISITSAAALVQPRFGLVSGLGIIILTLVVDSFLDFPLLAKFGRILNYESSDISAGRFTFWSAAWAMFLDAPLLGHGVHTYAHQMGPWTHNLYLEVLAEQGIVGLIALGFLFSSGVSTAWNIQRAALSESRILAAGPLAGLIGFSFAAVLELSFLREWVVIVLFSLSGVMAQLTSAKQNREVIQ